MATATPGVAPPAAQVAAELLAHKAPSYSFSFTPFLQKTYQHSLPLDRPICKAYASGSCPLKSHCSERHVTATPAKDSSSSYQSGGFGSLVCKHWLRGLCKKGESCEFLHEYNLRKMPECNFFVRNGYCSNGDECLYLHIDPQSKLPPCPHYDRGFCPLGPRCDKKHVRRQICVYYLAGFCPGGKTCPEGAHPRWALDKDMEKPKVREEKDPSAVAAAAAAREEQQYQQQQRERDERDARDRGGDRGDNMMDGGRGGRDRDGGDRGFHHAT
ncbi:hypothetical protein B0H63DRAFT_506282 [Podospora didyma]|uniref:mRNA 3'-end-processing protein n=1 Tax=Podospora didyma TaxID=330526 RepID=A0AAE0P7A6_9PEZI|nr:hypothetical protein B0H63DRAFT_506282 [Podospora didyma]